MLHALAASLSQIFSDRTPMVNFTTVSRWLPLVVCASLLGCTEPEPETNERMTIGVVSYGASNVSLEKYQRFQNYLAEQTKIPFDLEIAYNELQAAQQIDRGNWQVVFAPPGLAAMADKRGYEQQFVLDRPNQSEYALIVVRADSEVNEVVDLGFKDIAMGEPGSAAGYYLPLYYLYGLTLNKVHFAPTPATVLEWVSDGTVAAGAISEQEFETFRTKFPDTEFKVLLHSKDQTAKERPIPPGVVLLGVVERGQGEFIARIMREAPADITSDAQYIPTGNLPDYKEMVRVVEKIKPLESQVKQSPAVLTLEHLDAVSSKELTQPVEAAPVPETVPADS
ncbi:phosphate/phosphite/phosphonate ABC transporter substrate-binding protein [Leptothoe kymatousa]|nr:PhnD/SsuA/transferrin family substrate-binding protein [Leptothoe kymatousa]